MKTKSTIFWPYNQESVLVSSNYLGDKIEEIYKIVMTGQTKSGKSVTKETSHIGTMDSN
jgi:hypothetical protein